MSIINHYILILICPFTENAHIMKSAVNGYYASIQNTSDGQDKK
ncbi:hypothetical protein MHK_005014 [Candidatus Magnetomorum sp. HK-1]|nr:hypothetical protein MHK_005014 [Candidatus Magnetomorum sp. HK-1]